MAGIGIHFFVQKYAIPTFQVTRLLSCRSHCSLGPLREPRALLERGRRVS